MIDDWIRTGQNVREDGGGSEGKDPIRVSESKTEEAKNIDIVSID